jgi:hypothetical protein
MRSELTRDGPLACCGTGCRESRKAKRRPNGPCFSAHGLTWDRDERGEHGGLAAGKQGGH